MLHSFVFKHHWLVADVCRAYLLHMQPCVQRNISKARVSALQLTHESLRWQIFMELHTIVTLEQQITLQDRMYVMR